MPHLTLECTRNLHGFDVAAALMKLNRTLLDSGHFKEIDIKSRAMALEDFLVGTVPEGYAFLHAKLSILKGRPTDVRRAVSSSLLRVLHELCPRSSTLHVQLCVELLEIDGEVYSKETIAT